MTTTDHTPIVFVRDEVHAMLTAEPTDFTQAQIRDMLHKAGQDMAERAAADQPQYVTPDNPWKPWVLRTGGLGLGACLGTVVTILADSPMILWAIASLVAVALLFAWVCAGHELYERHPKKFKPVQ
jgi:hypothetical protein